MPEPRLCMHDDGYPAEPGKRKCIWHLLLKMPTEEQIEAAERRRANSEQRPGYSEKPRVGKGDWPIGERWCAGCQGFVPLFYCTGSRCKAHNAQAAHSGALVAKYDITREQYLQLLALQGGKCYICNQLPRTKRLAVDHDHKTGEVRGLLCADMERGCNHAVLGSLEARSVDGVIAAAYRLIDYMTKTPFQRLKEAPNGRDTATDADRCVQQGVAAREPAAGALDGLPGSPCGQVPDHGAADPAPGQPARREAPLPGPPGADWRTDPDWAF